MKSYVQKALVFCLGTSQRAGAELANLSDGDLVRVAQAGDNEAREILFSRSRPLFLSFANAACGNPTDAEDLCQVACIKANSCLSKLLDADTFVPWARRIVFNAHRNSVRDQQKSGTPPPENVSYKIETMIVEVINGCRADLETLLVLLSQRVAQMADPLRRVAGFLLESFELEHEFPSVRAIVAATGLGHGTAQRGRTDAILAFRHTLTALGLQP